MRRRGEQRITSARRRRQTQIDPATAKRFATLVLHHKTAEGQINVQGTGFKGVLENVNLRTNCWFVLGGGRHRRPIAIHSLS